VLKLVGSAWIFRFGVVSEGGGRVTDGPFTWLPLAVLPLCIALLCFGLPWATTRMPWLCPVLTFGAIPFGVFAYGMIDNTMDHNLLGIEIVIAPILAFPGAVVGGAAGVFLSRRAERRTTVQQSAPPLPRARRTGPSSLNHASA
jgi:hypothetical protein